MTFETKYAKEVFDKDNKEKEGHLSPIGTKWEKKYVKEHNHFYPGEEKEEKGKEERLCIEKKRKENKENKTKQKGL